MDRFAICYGIGICLLFGGMVIGVLFAPQAGNPFQDWWDGLAALGTFLAVAVALYFPIREIRDRRKRDRASRHLLCVELASEAPLLQSRLQLIANRLGLSPFDFGRDAEKLETAAQDFRDLPTDALEAAYSSLGVFNAPEAITVLRARSALVHLREAIGGTRREEPFFLRLGLFSAERVSLIKVSQRASHAAKMVSNVVYFAKQDAAKSDSVTIQRTDGF